MSRRDDSNDQFAQFACGVIIWVITAGIGLIVALIAWDRRRQREKYPDGKPISSAAESQRQAYILFGIALALLGGLVCYFGAYQSAYSSGSAVPIFIVGLASLLGGCGLSYTKLNGVREHYQQLLCDVERRLAEKAIRYRRLTWIADLAHFTQVMLVPPPHFYPKGAVTKYRLRNRSLI